MKLKLVIDGHNQRIRVTPDERSKSDQKLIEYILEWDIGRIQFKKDPYTRDVSYVDFVFENDKENEDENGHKDMILPIA
jgi:hypothetical protein